MQFKVSDKDIYEYLNKEYDNNNSINLLKLYKYLFKKLNTENTIDKNGKNRLVYEKIYELIIYLKDNNNLDNNRIQLLTDNEFIFEYYDNEKMENNLGFFRFIGDFYILSLKYKNISLLFKDVEILGNLNITNCKNDIQFLNIEYSHISYGIYLKEIKNNKSIVINNTISHKLFINGTKTENLIISNLKGNCGGIKNIELSGLQNLKILSINFLNNFRIQDLYLHDIRFKDYDSKYDNDYFIMEIIAEKLRLDYVMNSSESLVFSNIDIIDILSIKNSNLGNSIFNNIKLLNIELKNSTLNNCIFNGIDFCNNYRLIENKNLDGSLQVNSMKDNYRQMKHVMDKNGNHTEANRFFALEMEYYGKTLMWDKIDFVNKLIHEFQLYSSNFGNNWFRTFIIIIGFAFISTLYNQFHLWSFHDYLMDLKHFLVVFINLLNPFFGFSKGVYESLKEYPGIYFGFVVYKIFYGILVYQLIIALKRTTRR